MTRLLRAAVPHLRSIEDLPTFFAEPVEIRRSLQDLLRHRRTWRGEVRLKPELGQAKPLLVRADPVFSSPNRVLGFVLLFIDVTERKAAEAARRRFQEGIIERHRMMSVPLDSETDLAYRNLMSLVVGNAQLAALEITDSVDLAHMPEMLESVETSVTRTAELLEHLIWHATSESDRER